MDTQVIKDVKRALDAKDADGLKVLLSDLFVTPNTHFIADEFDGFGELSKAYELWEYLLPPLNERTRSHWHLVSSPRSFYAGVFRNKINKYSEDNIDAKNLVNQVFASSDIVILQVEFDNDVSILWSYKIN